MTGKELKEFVAEVHDDAVIEHDLSGTSDYRRNDEKWEELKPDTLRATLKPKVKATA